MMTFNNSNPKTPNMVMVMMTIFVDHPLNITKLLDMARNGNRSFLIEPILILGYLQQLHKQWVVNINHWNHEPLLLFALTNHDSQTPFRDIFQVLLMMMEAMKVRYMKVKIHMVMGTFVVISTPHIFPKKNKKKTKPFFLEDQRNKRL